MNKFIFFLLYDMIILVICMDKYVYLLDTKEDFIKEENISKLIKDYPGYEVIKFDSLETNERPLEELNTLNFLVEHKLIIINNCNIDDDLIKYIDNPNKDNILLIITGKLDKKIEKQIGNKVNVLKNNIDIKDVVTSKLEDYKMDNFTINYLISYCMNDNDKILTELDKLKAYKLEEKVITKEDIDILVEKSISNNIFDLSDAIMKKDKKSSIEIYNNIINKGTDTASIIGLISGTYILYLQCKILSRDGKNKDSIAEYLGIHPYRVSLALEQSTRYSKDDLTSIIKSLFNLDYQFKIGNGTLEDNFKQFIINL